MCLKLCCGLCGGASLIRSGSVQDCVECVLLSFLVLLMFLGGSALCTRNYLQITLIFCPLFKQSSPGIFVGGGFLWVSMSIVVIGCGALKLASSYVRDVVTRASAIRCRVVLISGTSASNDGRIFTRSGHVGCVCDSQGLKFNETGGLKVQRTGKQCLFFLGSSAVLLGGTIGLFFSFYRGGPSQGVNTMKTILGSRGRGGVRSCNQFVAPENRVTRILNGCLQFLGGHGRLYPTSMRRPAPISCVAKTSLFIPQVIYSRLKAFSPMFFVCYRRMS